MENSEIFWDKKLNRTQLKAILGDTSHPRFIEFAALLLSRTNNSKIVFKNYLDKMDFVKHWNKIKIKMRQNKWSDNRIIYWNEFYAVIKEHMNTEEAKKMKEKRQPKDKALESIGGKICKTRITKGWTQKDLAKQANLSQQTISFVERGFVNISFETLKRITNVLDMDMIIDVRKKPGDSVYTTTISTSF